MMSNLYVQFEHTHTGFLKSFSLERMSHERNACIAPSIKMHKGGIQIKHFLITDHN